MRIVLLAALLVSGPVRTARADAPTTEARTVELVVAGSAEEAAALEGVAGELLERLDVELHASRLERLDVAATVTPDPSAPPAVARAWIDLAPPETGDGPRQAVMILADAAWERLRVRRVTLESGVDEVVREELAHMLASGVEGLLAGRPLEQTREEVRVELGMPPEPPPPPPPAPPPALPPPPEPRALGLDLGVGYDLSGFGDAAYFTHGPFASLGLGLLWLPWRPEVWLTVQYRVPLDVVDDPIGVRLDQGVLRLLFSVDVPLARDFALLVLVGGGMDVVRATPQLARAIASSHIRAGGEDA